MLSILTRTFLVVLHLQGKAIGVGIGCILGMFPLLFFKDDEEKKAEGGEEQTPLPAATAKSA